MKLSNIFTQLWAKHPEIKFDLNSMLMWSQTKNLLLSPSNIQSFIWKSTHNKWIASSFGNLFLFKTHLFQVKLMPFHCILTTSLNTKQFIHLANIVKWHDMDILVLILSFSGCTWPFKTVGSHYKLYRQQKVKPHSHTCTQLAKQESNCSTHCL